MREGVCCTCQQVHPVRKGSEDPTDLDEVEIMEDQGANWVMATHDAFGGHCEGSGTMPQALVASRGSTSLDDLNRDVTAAIATAEYFEDTGSESCAKAYRKVSALEEQIAGHPESQAIEREVGRRGAISAAEKAGDTERATALRTRWGM